MRAERISTSRGGGSPSERLNRDRATSTAAATESTPISGNIAKRGGVPILSTLTSNGGDTKQILLQQPSVQRRAGASCRPWSLARASSEPLVCLQQLSWQQERAVAGSLAIADASNFLSQQHSNIHPARVKIKMRWMSEEPVMIFCFGRIGARAAPIPRTSGLIVPRDDGGARKSVYRSEHCCAAESNELGDPVEIMTIGATPSGVRRPVREALAAMAQEKEGWNTDG